MSKLKKTTEVEGAIEVGKFYLVPFAVGKEIADTPILLPVHRDNDFFPDWHPAHVPHYHNDVRFISDERYHPEPVYRLKPYEKGQVIRKKYKVIEDSNRGLLIRESDVQKIVWRRRKCRRLFPDFDKANESNVKKFHKPLADVAKKKAWCLKSNRICPHRGFNLRSIEPDENGIIECPMHGLRFHAESGKLVDEKLEKICGEI